MLWNNQLAKGYECNEPNVFVRVCVCINVSDWKTTEGTSLVGQWLRLCTPNAGGPGSIPGQGPRAHMPQLRPSRAQKSNKYFPYDWFMLMFDRNQHNSVKQLSSN